MLKVTYTQPVLYHRASSPAWKPQLSLQTLWFIEIATSCSQLAICLFVIYTHVKVSFVESDFLWIMLGYFLTQGFAWKWMQSVEEGWLCPSHAWGCKEDFLSQTQKFISGYPCPQNRWLLNWHVRTPWDDGVCTDMVIQLCFVPWREEMVSFPFC